MKDFFRLRVVSLLLLLCCAVPVSAQNRVKTTFRGTIYSIESTGGGILKRFL